jgi:hypothetical protein
MWQINVVIWQANRPCLYDHCIATSEFANDSPTILAVAGPNLLNGAPSFDAEKSSNNDLIESAN